MRRNQYIRGFVSQPSIRRALAWKPDQKFRAAAVWKEFNRWKYEFFERDIEPEMLPGFENLVRLWRKKQGDRPVPAWSDFDFHDFVGWHGSIAVPDVFHDPFDYRYRLFGDKLAERLEVDCTGELLSELVECGLEPPENMEIYEMTSRKMLITRDSGQRYRLHRPDVSTTFVEFPLSDADEMTTHILTAMT
jgi:hypothetical protein